MIAYYGFLEDAIASSLYGLTMKEVSSIKGCWTLTQDGDIPRFAHIIVPKQNNDAITIKINNGLDAMWVGRSIIIEGDEFTDFVSPFKFYDSSLIFIT